MTRSARLALDTLTQDDFDETLRRKWPSVSIHAEAMTLEPSLTIRPKNGASDSAGHRALGGLASDVSQQIALDIESTIGEGGMGIVRLATQRSLGRKVVVKTLRRSGDPEDALRLLREAWVTGSLEHPNIVPVHDLGLDSAGLPVIVLKRIEGVMWSELIADPARVQREKGVDDALEYHLGIFSHVCNAIALAHARGVIHRDLKPENVMVGAFGEVYVVDWGIAVSLRDDATGRFPLASDAHDVAGTPAYMAPEMLGGSSPEIGERTDVYLLGAVLYEILTGKAPHEAKSLREMVASILASDVTLPATAPPELARICKRATAPDAKDRFASVEELRSAVQGFLKHRGSEALASDASTRLHELREILSSIDPTSEQQRTRLYNVFGECRFGFRQALRSWSDNVAAKDGLVSACEAMIEFELRRGFPEHAAAILAELESPSPALEQRVHDELEKRAHERASMERIKHRYDPSIGSRTRAVWGAVAGLFFTLTPLVGIQFEKRVGLSAAGNLRNALLLLAVSILVVVSRWKALSQTQVNRRMALAVVLTLAGQVLLEIGGNVLGIPPESSIVLHFFLWFMAAALLSLAIDRRMVPSAIGYLAAFLYLCKVPSDRWPVMVLANFVLAANIYIAWRRPRKS
jgi:serine/threonine-protein kinase